MNVVFRDIYQVLECLLASVAYPKPVRALFFLLKLLAFFPGENAHDVTNRIRNDQKIATQNVMPIQRCTHRHEYEGLLVSLVAFSIDFLRFTSHRRGLRVLGEVLQHLEHFLSGVLCELVHVGGCEAFG